MEFYFSHFRSKITQKCLVFILNISIFALKFENCQKYYLEMRLFCRFSNKEYLEDILQYKA